MTIRDISYTNKKNPRYLKQRNGYSCAVIAILNLLKNLGYKYTYRDYKTFERWLHCNQYGTEVTDIHDSLNTIQYYFPEIKDIEHYAPLTLKIIDKALKNNRIVLVNFHFLKDKQEHSHIFLLTRATKKMYECINAFGKHTISLINRKALSNRLRRYRDGYPSYGWIIEKEKK